MLNVEDQKQTSTTGHVFLVNSTPKEITPRKPLVEARGNARSRSSTQIENTSAPTTRA